jgi:Cu/Ag efflux protein CusF
MKPIRLLAALALTITTAALADMPKADGEVRKIDLGAKKITLKHGEIRNLDMPPMTMVFQVKDPAMLQTVKVGDKVKFTVENANGAMTVLTMEPIRE